MSFYKVKNKITQRDSWNYMPPILVPSSAKPNATHILVTSKLHENDVSGVVLVSVLLNVNIFQTFF